jgi:hypothetical protein
MQVRHLITLAKEMSIWSLWVCARQASNYTGIGNEHLIALSICRIPILFRWHWKQLSYHSGYIQISHLIILAKEMSIWSLWVCARQVSNYIDVGNDHLITLGIWKISIYNYTGTGNEHLITLGICKTRIQFHWHGKWASVISGHARQPSKYIGSENEPLSLVWTFERQATDHVGHFEIRIQAFGKSSNVCSMKTQVPDHSGHEGHLSRRRNSETHAHALTVTCVLQNAKIWSHRRGKQNT